MENTNNERGYWIPKRVEDKSFVGGYRYLPSATCSVCGKEVNIRKEVCPFCGAIMDGPQGTLKK